MEPLTWNYTYSVWIYPLFKCYFKVIKVPYQTKENKISTKDKIKPQHTMYTLLPWSHLQ